MEVTAKVLGSRPDEYNYDYDYDYIMAPQRGRPYGANLGSGIAVVLEGLVQIQYGIVPAKAKSRLWGAWKPFMLLLLLGPYSLMSV